MNCEFCSQEATCTIYLYPFMADISGALNCCEICAKSQSISYRFGGKYPFGWEPD